MLGIHLESIFSAALKMIVRVLSTAEMGFR